MAGDEDYKQLDVYGKVEPVGVKVHEIMNTAPKSYLLEQVKPCCVICIARLMPCASLPLDWPMHHFVLPILQAERKKEKIYLSSKREPLGKPYVRGHEIPNMMTQQGFGMLTPQAPCKKRRLPSEGNTYKNSPFSLFPPHVAAEQLHARRPSGSFW